MRFASGATSYDVLFDNSASNVTGTSKKYTGLKAGSKHSYAVRAKNSNVTGAYSTTQYVTTSTAKPQVPAVPGNLKKSATETTATISWGAVSGATGYEIKFNGTNYSLTGTSKTFSNLTAGKSYSFSVRAKNANGYSAYTTSMTVTLPPKAPSTVSATSTSNSVTVNWGAVSGATGYIVKFGNSTYNVEKTKTSYTFSNLTANTSYSYQVCCKSADGTGSYGTAKTIKTQAVLPAVPSNIKKSATSASATISWGAVTGATGYTLQFNGTDYSVSGTSKIIYNLTSGKSYEFRVCAKNSGGSGNYSPKYTVTTPPASPTGISATSTDTTATIKWNAMTGASGYTLKFNNTNYEVGPAQTSYTITGLKELTSYSYQVCSKSADGTGSFSTAKTIKTLETLPGAPTNIQHSTTNSSVTISWGSVTGAASYDILFDGKVYNVTGTSKEFTGFRVNTSHTYQIRSKKSNGKTGDYSQAKTAVTAPNYPAISITTTENSATVSWNAVTGATGYDVFFNNSTYTVSGTSKTITGLKANTSYTCKVRSRNADGAGEYCAAKSCTTTPAAPSAPKTSSPGRNSVTISWDRVTGATSYDLLFDGTTYRVSGTSKTVSGLKAGTSYNYAVRSNNADGSSSYSATKTITTLPEAPASPGNISATSTEDSVTVTWGASTGATEYELWFNGTKYTVTGTSKTITGLKADTSYSYYLIAKNAGGSSAFSLMRSIRTQMKKPDVPTGLSAVPGTYDVTVSWTKVTGAASYELLFNGKVYSVTATSCMIPRGMIRTGGLAGSGRIP